MASSLPVPPTWAVILDGQMTDVEEYRVAGGRACVMVRRRPGRTSENEDSALVAPLDEKRAVLVVADGAGGLPDACEASQRAIDSMASALADEDTGDVRARIEQGFRAAHAEILALGSGAATTVSLVFIDGSQVWSYHIGDSMTLILGAGGERSFQTIPHSPVGYAVRDGLLSEEQAIHHEELHLVSNLLGIGKAEVELKGPVTLAPGSTLILGSDGLFDNLLIKEIGRRMGKRDLKVVAKELSDEVLRRMTRPAPEDPSKPDDLSFILFRLDASQAPFPTRGDSSDSSHER